MNRTERFYQIDQLLSGGTVMTKDQLLEALAVSWATLKRDLAYLRDRFHAPIMFDKDAGGYRFSAPSVGPAYELPGLWFSAKEAHALMTMHELLTSLEPGLLSPHIDPLLSRLETIAGRGKLEFPKIAERIRVDTTGQRRKNPAYFAVVSQAVLGRLRLRVQHYSRENDTYSERVLSPQRLSFYKNNWYLEAWCHSKEALRRFSVDAIAAVELLNDPAVDVSATDLDAAFGTSYGAYAGKANKTAKLRFSKEATRWVADEQWHPLQLGKIDDGGHLVLKVPYADATEIRMDILRHGHHVEVLAPKQLRIEVAQEADRMRMIYGDVAPRV